MLFSAPHVSPPVPFPVGNMASWFSGKAEIDLNNDLSTYHFLYHYSTSLSTHRIPVCLYQLSFGLLFHPLLPEDILILKVLILLCSVPTILCHYLLFSALFSLRENKLLLVFSITMQSCKGIFTSWLCLK